MIESYVFTDLDGRYTYTSQTDAANYLPIAHSPLKITGNIFADDVNVAVAADRNDEMPWVKWASGADAGKVHLTLMQGSDVAYRGSLVSVQVGMNALSFKFTSRLRVRRGLRRRYQRGCNYQFVEGNTCRANVVIESRVVSSLSGRSFAVVMPVANHENYINGTISYSNRNYWIVSVEDDSNFTLNLPPQGLSVGDSINMRSGCDKVFKTCKERYGNSRNYGGFPHLPEESPFGKIYGEGEEEDN